MDLVTATQERLRALLDGQSERVFIDVEGALELAQIIDQGNPKRDRTGYVLLNADSPDPATTGSGPATQRLVLDVVVVIALKATNSALGTNTALQDIRSQVRQALFDWSPADDEHEPYTLGGGRLLTFRNGWIYWADSFRSDTWE